MTAEQPNLVWFDAIGRADVALVGGKSASLGEMIRTLGPEGIRVPPGFATTSHAYWRFLDENNLRVRMGEVLAGFAAGKLSLSETGQTIRAGILQGTWPTAIAGEIIAAYRRTLPPGGLGRSRCRRAFQRHGGRSAAGEFRRPAGDLTSISAETQALLDACRQCIASLFTDRAISYRKAKGFDHMRVALSVGVQRMVRSDLGGAGVMFSIDTETGFDKVVLINAAWGLGENVVQGTVDPDEYHVFKPSLADPALSPIIEKKLGAKTQKMIYATGATVRHETSRHQRRSGRHSS